MLRNVIRNSRYVENQAPKSKHENQLNISQTSVLSALKIDTRFFKDNKISLLKIFLFSVTVFSKRFYFAQKAQF